MPVGIVRIGDKDRAGVLADHLKYRIDIRVPVLFGGNHRRGTGRARGNIIHQEPVLGADHLITRTGIGVTEKGDDFIRTGPADDPLWVEPVHLADGSTQVRVIAGRV